MIWWVAYKLNIMTNKIDLMVFSFLAFFVLTFYGVNSFGQASSIAKEEICYEDLLYPNVWCTNAILGLNPTTETYELTKFVPGLFAGNLTRFLDNGQFRSEFTAWCRNDNFTIVDGKYEFLSIDKLNILVESVTYTGDWNGSVGREPLYLTYTLSSVGDTIILTRQK